jgi:hypothetical protein
MEIKGRRFFEYYRRVSLVSARFITRHPLIFSSHNASCDTRPPDWFRVRYETPSNALRAAVTSEVLTTWERLCR